MIAYYCSSRCKRVNAPMHCVKSADADIEYCVPILEVTLVLLGSLSQGQVRSRKEKSVSACKFHLYRGM